MRLKTRSSLLAGAVLMAVLPAVAQAAPAVRSAPAVVSVAGVTSLSGSSPASVRVRVPKAATLRNPLFDPAGVDAVKVSGKGRAVAFALVSDDRKRVLFGGRMPTGATASKIFVQTHIGFEEGARGVEIPPGGYRLYLMPDGSPATITLRLQGLGGTSRLAPRDPARYTLSLPDPDVDTAPARVAYAAGADEYLSRPSVLFGALAVTHDLHAVTDLVNCFHVGKPAGPSPYSPPCADTGDTRPLFFNSPVVSEGVARQTKLLTTTAGPFPAGHYGVGGSFASATPALDTSYFHFWLGL